MVSDAGVAVEMDEQKLKEQLIKQMGSIDNATALDAIEELRKLGWLQNGYLAGINLKNANLANADLSRANLERANLEGTVLLNANLQASNLAGASLKQAALENAYLHTAILHSADLSKAYLAFADFTLAILQQTNLTEADLSRAFFSSNYFKHTNFKKAKCLWTIFSYSNLSEAIGLEDIDHIGPSILGVETIYKSDGKIPEEFLRGCGIPENLIEYLPSLMNQAIDFYSCFISYSSKDQSFCDFLASQMRGKGLRVWYAPDNMQGGKKIHEQIGSAIRLHDKLILVLSEHSIKSDWVQTELRRALKREKDEKRRVLFPIRLCSYEAFKEWELIDGDSGRDLAVEVREYFIPDFSNWKDDQAFATGFERLIKDLRKSEEEQHKRNE